MAGQIRTVYVPKEFETAWTVFEAIAEREKGDRGLSKLLNEVVAEYAKKHGKGNPAYSLELFQEPNFVALPTIYEDPTTEKVHSLSAEDKKTIMTQMTKWYNAIQR